MDENFKHKDHHLFIIPYAQTINFNIQAPGPVDKIRISIGGDIELANFIPCIKAYSDLTNNVIGVIANKLLSPTAGGTYLFMDKLEPANGMTIYYENKIIINGGYTVRFTNLDGTVPNVVTGNILILVEYFQG